MRGAIGGVVRDHVEHVRCLGEAIEEELPFEPLLQQPGRDPMNAGLEVLGIVAGDDEFCLAGGHVRFRGAIDDVGFRPVHLGFRTAGQEPEGLLA